MCLPVNLICAWFHFLFNLGEAGKMGSGKEMQGYFSFPVTGKKQIVVLPQAYRMINAQENTQD